MCQQLEVPRNFGFREAVVQKNVNYVWHQSCDSIGLEDNSSEIKFMTSPDPFDVKKSNYTFTTISGAQLFLADYLSLSLNMTIKFVHSGSYLVVSIELERFFKIS